MLERVIRLAGLRGGVLVALGLALAVPSVGCKKEEKKEDEDKDKKKSKKDDDDEEKDSKKKKDDDDDDDKGSKKKKKKDDDDDDSKSAKKTKAPKNVDDEDDDEDDDDSPKKKAKSLKPITGDVDLTGSYTLAGKGQDGVKYKGSATISKIGGQMYKGTWKIGTTTFQGIAFRDGNVLSCGWSPKHDLGVVAYLVKPGTLDGVWFEEQHTTLGKELLKGPAGATVSGKYIISDGETPDKKKYSGSVDISIYKSGVFKLQWKAGTFNVKGLGLRSKYFPGSNTDVLSAGFNDSGNAGVLQYIILDGGHVLTGHWAQTNTNGGEPSWGVESMTKL